MPVEPRKPFPAAADTSLKYSGLHDHPYGTRPNGHARDRHGGNASLHDSAVEESRRDGCRIPLPHGLDSRQ